APGTWLRLPGSWGDGQTFLGLQIRHVKAWLPAPLARLDKRQHHFEVVPESVAPVDAVPVHRVPVDAVPVHRVPVDAVPVHRVPVDAVPGRLTVADVPVPTERNPCVGGRRGVAVDGGIDIEIAGAGGTRLRAGEGA